MIFTERTITIRKGVSTINESIILYRGDFQVGLKFTILDSKYKFLNGANLIESEKATYAQLAVLKPKGDNIFSDVVKCSEGSVTFTMTKDMIDELEEVGKYSFQIRLFDANKESRVSIPPVEFGMEVREPVASEDHNNEVNKALTGYSIAKVTTIEEDKKVDTFDSNDNYNKTNWKTGDRITENKLNKIEDAINTLNNKDKTLDNRITSNHNITQSLLDGKVGFDDKISISMIDKNKGKIDQTYLSEELIKQMAGDSAINTVPADDSITTSKIVDGAITGTKTDFMELSGNLFNHEKVVDGFIGGVGGSINPSVSTAYSTSDFIKVTPNTKYYISRHRKLLQYNASKQGISGTYTEESPGMILTTSSTTEYIRVTFYTNNLNNGAMVIKSSKVEDFKPYGYAIGDRVKYINPDIIPSIDGSKINVDSISSDKLKFLQPSINLIDLSNMTPGYIEHVNGVISTSGDASTKYSTTGYIRVKANEKICFTSARKLVAFDPSMDYYEGVDIKGSADSHEYTPKIDGYVRISFETVNLGISMITVGDLPNVYTPGGRGIAKDSLGFIDGSIISYQTVKPTAMECVILGNLFDCDSPDNTDDAICKNFDVNEPWNETGKYGASHKIVAPYSGNYVFHNVRHIYVYNDKGKLLSSNSDCTSGTTYNMTVAKDSIIRITYFMQMKYGKVYVQYGNELDMKNSKAGYFLNGVNTTVDYRDVQSVDGKVILESSITTKQCQFIENGKNLFDYRTCDKDKYINPGGSFQTFVGMNTSDYIKIKANTDYHISKCRKLCVFDSAKIPQNEYGADIKDAPYLVNIPFDGYIKISVRTTYEENVQVEEGSQETTFEPFGIKIPLLINDSSNQPTTSTGVPSHVINLGNVDRIASLGDSYTDSHFTIAGKAYLCKLSLFSDYNWENFALSGDTYRGNLDRIRKGTARFHGSLSWKDFKPTYALMISYTNDLKYMNVEQYKNDLRAIIETTKGLGAIPILSTEYHTNFGPGIENALQGVANEYGLDVINILPKCTALRGKDYTPFWGGSHPGTRSNHILSDPLESYFKKMPRPFQSIKVFRVRESIDTSNLDMLIFNTNVERAEKFKEIMIGHSALNKPEEYDNCTNSANSRVTSEYLKIQNKEAVDFNKYALVDVVLPATARDINDVTVKIDSNRAENLNLYVKDVLAEPYASPAFYQRFDYDGSYDVKVGDTYTSNLTSQSGVTYTVKEVQNGTVLMSPCSRVTGESGVLTRTSGTGASRINFNYTAVGFSSNYVVGKQNIGHWTKLTNSKDGAFVSKATLERCMDYDKVSVLVEYNGTFNIRDISIVMNGEITKARPTLERHHISTNVLTNNSKQLLTEQFTGTTSQLSRWTLKGSITPYKPADGVLPLECSGCIDVTTTKSIKQSFNYTTFASDSKRALVRVWARYFPPIFDKNTMSYPSQSHITEDSYDYAKLNLVTSIGGKEFEMTDIVGLGWKEVEFEVTLSNQATSMAIEIESLDKDIQIAKVSVIEL